MALWHECMDTGLLEETAENNELHDMLFNGQCIGAKLAGALNSMVYDRELDGGFMIACLKRALPYFDDMIQALGKVRKNEILDATRLRRFSDDTFTVRAEIVQLMERFRDEME